MLMDRSNEARASMGELLVETMVRECEGERLPIVTCVEQALEAIAHCCDRFALDPDETFRDALRAYRKDLEAGPRASGWVRGEFTAMTEVMNVPDAC